MLIESCVEELNWSDRFELQSTYKSYRCPTYEEGSEDWPYSPKVLHSIRELRQVSRVFFFLSKRSVARIRTLSSLFVIKNSFTWTNKDPYFRREHLRNGSCCRSTARSGLASSSRIASRGTEAQIVPSTRLFKVVQQISGSSNDFEKLMFTIKSSVPGAYALFKSPRG